MKKKPGISRTFLVSMLQVSIIAIGLFSCLWTWQQYAAFRRESNALREMMLNSYRNLLKTQVKRSVDYVEYRKSLTEHQLRNSIQGRVDDAHAIASHLYEYWKDRKSAADIQSMIRESLRPMRFNKGRGYLFILDLNGINQLRGDHPELERRDMLADQESLEAKVVRDMIAIAGQKKEGFYQYEWTKPGPLPGVFPKIAFVKLFEPFGWIIGTGEYLDDFEMQIKEAVLSYLGTIRFGQDGYVFITQWDGMDLTGPAKGRNMLEVTDPNGVKIVQELIALAKFGGGFLRYVMPKFKGMKPDPKLSYVEGIADWQWYVGAGIYIDDIENAIDAKREEMTKDIVGSMLQIAVALLGIIAFVFYYTRRTMHNTNASFELFASFFDKAASQSVVIDPDEMGYEEFEKLAHSANLMIETRRQAEEASRKNQLWLQSILDSIQAGVMVIDPATHRILELNRAAAAMIGINKEDLIDTVCHNHICPADVGMCPVTDLGLAMEQADREMLKADGTRIPIMKTVNCATIDGKDYLIESFLDMSDKQRLESMLLQAQKMEAIGTLAGGIAHDFNNILSPIMAYSEMARMDLPADSAVQHHLSQIYKAAERARDLVKQILAFARSRDEERIPLKASLIVKEAIQFLKSTIPSIIQIHLDCHAQHDTILADPTQMNQIVMNLCTNAAYAMRENGGLLEVQLSNQEIGTDAPNTLKGMKPGQYLKLTVRDTGAGISADIIGKLFEPYFTTKPTGEGTGLGLAVAHGIVKSYDGEIVAESEIGKGSTFQVFLPITKPNAIVTAERKTEVPTGSERILLVDDEKAALEPMQMMLEKLGYKLTVRTSSVEALEAFRNNPNRFDLVITDMTMPNMTGKKLAKELIALNPTIPIILCTGFSDQIDENQAHELGIRAFLMKPIVMREMAKIIRKVLDEKAV